MDIPMIGLQVLENCWPELYLMVTQHSTSFKFRGDSWRWLGFWIRFRAVPGQDRTWTGLGLGPHKYCPDLYQHERGKIYVHACLAQNCCPELSSSPKYLNYTITFSLLLLSQLTTTCDSLGRPGRTNFRPQVGFRRDWPWWARGGHQQ